MTMIKTILNYLTNALTGLVAGLITMLALGWLWLHIIPVIDRTGVGAGLVAVLIYVAGYVTPVSIIGGFLGGLIPKEGTRKDQLFYAALVGGGLTTPVSLFLYWYTAF